MEAVTADPLTAPLNPQDKTLVVFAEKLTRQPGDICEGDIQGLRGHGFDDHAIHDAVQVIAMFNYYNRVADGLGVSLSDDNAA